MYAGSQCKTQMEANQFIRHCHYSGTGRSQLSARDCHSLDYTDKTSQQRKSPTRFVPFVGRLACSLLSCVCRSPPRLSDLRLFPCDSSFRPSVGWLTDCNLSFRSSVDRFRLVLPTFGWLVDCLQL